jgi:probable HAF family extracellular repeat protein
MAGGASCSGRPHSGTDDVTRVQSALQTTVVVTVKDTNGAAQAGATVFSETNGAFQSTATTDAQGQATFSLADGPYRFATPGLEDSFFFYSGAAGSCTTPSCTAATITTTLPVVVSVIDTSGAPQAGQQVYVEDAQGTKINVATSDASGVAQLSVSAGSYRFDVGGAGQGLLFYSGAPGSCAVPGCTTATVTITQPVDVFVVDSRGNPQPGFEVLAEDTNGVYVNLDTTDTTGHVLLSVYPGAYRFDAAGDSLFPSGAPGSCVVPGCTAVTITIPAPPGAGACAGQPDGTPCDDGDACTQGDICTGGTCRGPDAFSCTAPDGCHGAGTCNAGTASPQPPSTEDLIGWWKLDGNGADSSGGGHDLTNEGAAPAPGRFGLGMKFDGTTCMTAPIWDAARMQGATGVTMMAWVNPSDGYVCPVNEAAVMGRGLDYSAATHCWWGANPVDPNITGSVNRLGYPGGFGSAYHNQWTLEAITWDHQTLNIYINGKLVAADPQFQNSGDLTDRDPLFSIGCKTRVELPGERMSHFIGTIDEAMLYRRALSSSEIAAYWMASDPCTHPTSADGTACSDDNACTQADACRAGVCTGTLAIDDQNSCTADSCDPVLGPVHTAISEGAACDDGNRCTVGDSCHVGICLPGAATACTGGTTYYPPLVDLGVADGTIESRAYGINDSGQVVVDGFDTFNAVHPIRYSDAEGLTKIFAPVPGCPYCSNYWAVGINSSGLVVGGLPMFTQLDGQPPVQFPALGSNLANAVNDAGWIVGMRGDPPDGGLPQPFRYIPGPGLQLLGLLPNASGGGQAFGIDANGRVVGVGTVTPAGGTLVYHAFVYTDPGPIQDMNDLVAPGSGFTYLRSANAVSTSYVVGTAVATDGTFRGFRLHNDGTIDHIPSLPSVITAFGSEALALDARGDVVGYSSGSVGSHAFLYTNEGRLIDLNDFVDSNSGWVLRAATGINNNFEVVGYGTHGTVQRAFKIKVPNVAPCVATDACHVAGVRDPVTGVCSDPRAPDGIACDDGNRCSVGDSCQAGTCIPGPLTGCAAPGAAQYISVIDLGSSDGFSSASAINNLGEVTGVDTGPNGTFYVTTTVKARGFHWTQTEGRVYLPGGAPYSEVTSVNDSGVMGCSASPDGQSLRPCRYDPAVDSQPNLQAAPGRTIGINAAGIATGVAYLPGARMFRLGTGAIEALPSLPNADPYLMTAWGNDIDDNGTVVGAQLAPNGTTEAIRYSDTRLTEGLNDLLPADPAGGTWELQEARGAKPTTIVGWGWYNGLGRAFRLAVAPNGDITAIKNLGLPEPYGTDAANIAIATKSNASGEIVGAVYDSVPFWPQDAFVYTDATQMTNLNSLIDPESGWHLSAAFAINDNHEVVGFGYYNQQPRAFKLTLPGLNPCPAPANACLAPGVRDAATGACSYASAVDGTSCDDGNLCTQNDSCQAGKCVAGSVVTCTAQDQCHAAGSCNPATGACSNPARLDETPCSDGNACTQGDICIQGSCVPGLSVTCTALDACHPAGTCDPASGVCSNPVSPDPTCNGAPLPPVTTQPQSSPGALPGELAGVDPGTGTLSVGPSDGAGGPNPRGPTTTGIPALVGSTIGCEADVNGDGTTDIVFANAGSGLVEYLPRLAPHSTSYGQPVVIDSGAPAGAPGPAACGDVDGDGAVDIVMSFATPDGSGGTPTLIVYRSVNGSTFQRIQVPHGFPSGVAIGGLSLADFDGDGKPDLAVYAANNQPLLESQLFVFPNGGVGDPVTSGVLDQPFSQSTRVSVPGTDVMATPDKANWGALTTLDWDGDHHPDIWALGNTGGVFLYRSLGGFQFAAPEIDGVITDLGPQFTMGHVDATLDGIPDLLIDSPGAIGFPKVYPGAGGGVLAGFPNPLGGTHTFGTVSGWTKPLVIKAPSSPPAIGLTKGRPVVTSYPDEWGGKHPSILLQAVNGHLVERVEILQVTTTLTPVPQPPPPPIQLPHSVRIDLGLGCIGNGSCTQTGAGTSMTPTYTRTQTSSTSWAWIDHGVPSTVATGTQPAHQTIVNSLPAVALEDVGAQSLMRRIYVTGLDGHLWELDQHDGNETWVDDGLPIPGDNPNQVTFPIVAGPSAVPDFIDGRPLTTVFVMDASGRLDYFRPAFDSPNWNTAGPIGSNNCFGDIGALGGGSPKAISWVDDLNKLHKEVFVIGAEGDLFSWRDGSWEEILDVQYDVARSVLEGGKHDFPPDVRACPNGSSTPPPDPSRYTYNYKPTYERPFEATGTPDVAVWTQGGQLKRSVFVRGRSGFIFEYMISGDASGVAALDAASPTFDASDDSVVWAKLVGQSTAVHQIFTPYCSQADASRALATFNSDPVVLLTDDTAPGSLTDNALFVFSTDNMLRPTIYHRRLPDGGDEYSQHPVIPGIPRAFGDAVLGSPGAIPRFASASGLSSNSTPAATPLLDVFANRSTGVLIEGWGIGDGSGLLRTCDMDTTCGCQTFFLNWFCSHPDCNHGAFLWFVNDHTPPDAPVVLDNDTEASDLNEGGGRTNCTSKTSLDPITPQWISPQRPLSRDEASQIHDPMQHYSNGYDDDVMVEVEGVVIDSHIAASDTPINHTHGSAKDDIPRVHHDWNVVIAPDIQYQKLLTDANLLDRGAMELEWEMEDHLACTSHSESGCSSWTRVTGQDDVPSANPLKAGFTDDVAPAIGDRVSIRGRFIFDCGHPPYKTEIHPIDAIAVIHGNDVVKFRESDFGGMTWYEPADVNVSGGETCNIQDRLLEAAHQVVHPDDSMVSQVIEALNAYEFSQKCVQTYDTEIISPNAFSPDGNSATCYYPYQHKLDGDLFAETRTLGAASSPITLAPLDINGFIIQLQNGQQIPSPTFSASPEQTTIIYDSQASARRLNVCFQRSKEFNHDNIDGHEGTLCDLSFDQAPVPICCEDNFEQELVTFITAGDQTKIYSPNEDNCVQVRVFASDTLNVGSHGFECDMSCGENWADPEQNADDFVGFTRAAFTAQQNWGIGTFTMVSQPDLSTKRSRHQSIADYTMTVTITEIP